jgi:uncharacterized protein (DUF779 family)
MVDLTVRPDLPEGNRVAAALLAWMADVARAVAVLRQLGARHGPLLFHQSGGCCDGSCLLS